MHQRGLDERALGAELPDQRHHRHARPRSGAELLDDGRIGVADDDDSRAAGGRRQRAHASDDLAVQALLVEVALAGDHDVGGGDPVVELDVLGHEVEPADETSADGGEPTGQPARRAGAVERGDVDAVLVEVAPGQLLEPRRQAGRPRRDSPPSAGRRSPPPRRSRCARRRRPRTPSPAAGPGCATPRWRRVRRRSSPSRRARRRDAGRPARGPGRSARPYRRSRPAGRRSPRRRRPAPARSPAPSRSPPSARRAATPPRPVARAGR